MESSNMVMVSVVIPYYNSEKTLIRAMESVINQTYKDYEMILVNDGSTDQSADVVKKFAIDHPNISIKHHFQENGGPSKARNAGIRLAQGKYIAFLDSDDTWDPKKLEIQVALMEEDSDIAISGTNFYISSGEYTKYPQASERSEADFYRMLFKVFFCMPTVIIRKDVLEKEKLLFLEGKHYGEDLLFFLQIVRRYKGVRIAEPLTTLHKFLYGESGLSQNFDQFLVHDLDNLKILRNENYKSSKKIGVFLYFVLWLNCYAKHGIRLYKSRKYRKKRGC